MDTQKGEELVTQLILAAVLPNSMVSTKSMSVDDAIMGSNDDGIMFVLTVNMEDSTTLYVVVEGMVQTVTIFLERCVSKPTGVTQTKVMVGMRVQLQIL